MIQRPLSLKFMILFLGSYVIGGQIVFRYNWIYIGLTYREGNGGCLCLWSFTMIFLYDMFGLSCYHSD
jgi:hypothetical protein